MQIGFTVAVQKMAEPRNHRFTSLKVKELSIVTEPAILSQDESNEGVGTVVVKNAAEFPLRLPEDVSKAFAVGDGEDLWDIVKDLMNVVRMSLTTHLNDPDAYWDYHAAKVAGDSVLMTSWYSDPYAGATCAYKCTYSRGEDKAFKVDSITEMQVVLTPVAAAQKSADPEPEAAAAPAEPAVADPVEPEAAPVEPAAVEPTPPVAEPSIADAVKQAVDAAMAEIAEKHAAELAALQASVDATKVQSEEATTKLQQELVETRKGLLSQSASADAQAAAAPTYVAPKTPAEKAEKAAAAVTSKAFGLFTAPFHNTINKALQQGS